MPAADTVDMIGARERRIWASAAVARPAVAVLLLALIALQLTGPAFAQAVAGRDVSLTDEHSKQQFAAGDKVHISASIADDVFAVGREITLEGTRARAAFLAGGTIHLKDSTLHDLFILAHEVELLGAIDDDAVIAVCPVCPWGSNPLLVGPQARIGDDARLLAGTIEIQGTIGGDLTATARRIVISGTIGGKADLRANEIVIASGARLAGEFVARSPKKPEIATDATVAGPLREIQTEVNIPDPKDLPRILGWIAAAVAAIVVLGALLLGALGQLVIPAPLSRAATRMRSELWGCVGRGLAWALILPALAALLFVSLIGIPAGIILTAAYVVLWALASITAAYAIGLWLRSRRAREAPEPHTGGRIGWTLLGTLILLVAWVVPLVGWIFGLLALLGGLGAITAGAEQLRRADAAASLG
jgi:hypothetical protein